MIRTTRPGPFRDYDPNFMTPEVVAYLHTEDDQIWAEVASSGTPFLGEMLIAVTWHERNAGEKGNAKFRDFPLRQGVQELEQSEVLRILEEWSP